MVETVAREALRIGVGISARARAEGERGCGAGGEKMRATGTPPARSLTPSLSVCRT